MTDHANNGHKSFNSPGLRLKTGLAEHLVTAPCSARQIQEQRTVHEVGQRYGYGLSVRLPYWWRPSRYAGLAGYC